MIPGFAWFVSNRGGLFLKSRFFFLGMVPCLVLAFTGFEWALGGENRIVEKTVLDRAVKLYVRGEFEAALAELRELESHDCAEIKVAELRRIIMRELGMTADPKTPDTKEDKDAAAALCELGYSYTEERDFARAEILFLEAERRVDRYLPACVGLARLYAEQGDYYKSLERWKQAHDIFGDSGPILFGMALAYVGHGDMDRAGELFFELMMDPDFKTRAGAQAGRFLWHNGRREEAKKVWEDSIACMPMDGYVFFVIAECCQEDGDREGARLGYKKALDLGYQTRTCLDRLSLLMN